MFLFCGIYILICYVGAIVVRSRSLVHLAQSPDRKPLSIVGVGASLTVYARPVCWWANNSLARLAQSAERKALNLVVVGSGEVDQGWQEEEEEEEEEDEEWETERGCTLDTHAARAYPNCTPFLGLLHFFRNPEFAVRKRHHPHRVQTNVGSLRTIVYFVWFVCESVCVCFCSVIYS